MRRNKRTEIVQKAEADLMSLVIDLISEHDLTAVEAAVVLNRIAAIPLKWALQDERHPDDPTTPADVE